MAPWQAVVAPDSLFHESRGFSLHAATRVEGYDRERLETLCRTWLVMRCPRCGEVVPETGARRGVRRYVDPSGLVPRCEPEADVEVHFGRECDVPLTPKTFSLAAAVSSMPRAASACSAPD